MDEEVVTVTPAQPDGRKSVSSNNSDSEPVEVTNNNTNTNNNNNNEKVWLYEENIKKVNISSVVTTFLLVVLATPSSYFCNNC